MTRPLRHRHRHRHGSCAHPALAALTAATLLALTTALTTAPLVAADTTAGAVREERSVIGTSVQGRPIVAVHRWRDAPGAARTLVVIGSMHGDERAGTRVVRRLGDAALPKGVALWLVPTMNPDGAAAARRTNARGVDLNRNFPRFWRAAGLGTTTWSGPAAASEPETQALMSFLRAVGARTAVLIHQPLYGIDSYRAKSMTLVRRLSRETGLPARPFDCQGGCHGTLTDWHNARLPGRAVTIELGPRASPERVASIAAALLRVARR